MRLTSQLSVFKQAQARQNVAKKPVTSINGLGIMRACLETQKLERIEECVDEMADRAVANAAQRHRDQREGRSLQCRWRRE
jgi:hypothetical protein